MDRWIELSVLLTEEEKQILLGKHGDMMKLKAFLNKQLEKMVRVECEEISMSEPYVNTFKEPA